MSEGKSKMKADRNDGSDLKKNYDVIIVGSGPAGASAAKTLSGSGLDVVIIEKCSLPRDKMCSGVILPSARRFLSENYRDIPKNVFADPREVKGSRYLYVNDGQCQQSSLLAMDFGENLPEYGFNVYRSEFDLWLCRESGVLLVDNCLLIDHKQGGRDTLVRVKHNGEHSEIKARYLIGADGSISRVRRSVSPEFDKSLSWVAVYEGHYEGQIDLEPGWMYWIVDREMGDVRGSLLHKGKSIHISIGTSQVASCKSLFMRFVEVLMEKYGLEIDKTIMKRGIVINDMPYKENYLLGNGTVLLVGEAAGFVRGLDGISSALLTGKAAGESILKSIRSGRTPLEYYREHALIVSERETCKKVHRKLPELGLR